MPSQIDLAAQRIAETLAPATRGASVLWRWATVEAVNADGTMDVTIGGTSVPALTALRSASGASVGDRVRVDYLDADAVVTGVVASAPGASTPAGTVLWSGTYYMTADHTADLAYNISTCHSGVVLHFQPYTSGTLRDYNHVYYFVPKVHSLGISVPIVAPNFSSVATKYLYVYDNRIVGHADNTATGTNNGITYNNGAWVMTQVIAV